MTAECQILMTTLFCVDCVFHSIELLEFIVNSKFGDNKESFKCFL